MENDNATNSNNAVIDISEEHTDPSPSPIFDIFTVGLRKTPRKKVAVEKYSDDSFLQKKKKTPKPKGSNSKKKSRSSSSSKKRKSSETAGSTPKNTTITNDDGTITTTQTVVDLVTKKTIITITTTTLGGTEPLVTIEEIDLPKKKAKTSQQSKSKKDKAANSVFVK